MTRSLKVYQGEDLSPVRDLTEPTSNVHVIWDEVEAGGKAYRGDSSISTFPMRDEQGESGSPASLPGGLTHISLSAGNRLEWLVDGHRLFRGRIGPKDYSRGRQKADRAREVTVSAQDTNWDLRGIIVDGWARPEETDVARVQALVSDYLTGDPRVTTNISTDYVNTGSNIITLPARVYDATSPAEVLSEIGAIANKLHFVTIDDELFYDGWDSAAYQAGIRISDRHGEWDTETVCGPGEDAEVSSAGGLANNGESQAPVTVAGGSGGLVAVVVTDEDCPTPTPMWEPDSTNPGADQAMTIIGTVTHPTPSSGGNRDGEKMWVAWLANPTPSTANDPGIVWEGVNASNHFGSLYGYWTVSSSTQPTVSTNYGTGSTASVTPSASTGDLVLDCAGYRFWSLGNESNTPNATAGQTEEWTIAFNNSAGRNDSAWGGGTSTGPGARTWDLVKSTNWVAAAIVFGGDSSSGDVATFPPIWDMGPSSTEDGMQMLSGARLYYGQGSNTYVYASRPTIANQYWHHEESLYISDPGVNTAAKATTLLTSILARRGEEERSYNVSIGPLEESHVGCLKPGQLINIKARAIPDADDAYVSRRIANLRWTTPVPGMYFAHMQLDRPMKEAPYGVGAKQATDSINRHVEQGSNSHPEYVQRGILVSQGDIPYRGASDWTRLPIGSSNTHLISDGQVPKWVTNVGGVASTLWYNVKDYGAAGNGSSNDTSAINSAIAALNSNGGGVLYFPHGTYLISSALTTITVPCVVRGDGGGFPYASGVGSQISQSSDTANAFTFSDDGWVVRDLGIVNTEGAPSAGAGIASGNALHARMQNVTVSGFFDCIDISDGAGWALTDSFIRSPVRYGIRIRGTVSPDSGDQSISGCTFHADDHNATAAIRQESAGGLKIVNTKINNRGVGAGGKFVDGLSVSFASSAVSTSILMLTNVSIENVSGDGIDIATLTTAQFYGIHIANSQVGLFSNNTGRAIKISAAANGLPGTAGMIAAVSIIGNTFRTDGTARAAIELTNVNLVSLGANELLGFNDLYTGTGNTNVTVLTGGAEAFDDLSDVTITGVVEGEMPRWDGSAWVNDSGLICVDPGSITVDAGPPFGVTLESDWGIDADDGQPYYDDAGAAAGEEAALFYDPLNDRYTLIPYDF